MDKGLIIGLICLNMKESGQRIGFYINKKVILVGIFLFRIQGYGIYLWEDGRKYEVLFIFCLIFYIFLKGRLGE